MVSLSEARDIAIDNVRLRRRGINPIAERTRSRTVPTFAAACDAYLDLQRASWKAGSRVESNWRSSFAHAKAIHDRPVDAVETHDVIAVVSALYRDGKDATARSLRQRIRAVMEWARAEEHRTDNPADGRIDAALPKAGRVTKHREAMAWREVPALFARLAKVTGPQRGAALGLRFLILTGVRRDEARVARWTEIDTETATWTVPAERTKTGKVHRIPLAPAALAVFDEAKRSRCRGGLVFCGARKAQVSETAFLDLLKAHTDGATVHGFRSTFRDWCAEHAGAPGSRRIRTRARGRQDGAGLCEVRPARPSPSRHGRLGRARHRGDPVMARRDSGRQPAPITAETVAKLHDALEWLLRRPAHRGLRRNRNPDRNAIVNTLRGYFKAVGNHHRMHYLDCARYRMFARWAAEVVINPELASACRESIEAAASKDLEAWHATLMIRIVMQAWRRCADSDGEDGDEDDERIEMPLPWDSDARSTAAAGGAYPASLADIFDMPPPPVRRRPYTDDETRKLVAEAVRYCLSHGFPATRQRDRMDIDCGCLLVAEAWVPADVWKQTSQENRIAAAESVKRDWNAYRKWERRRSGEYIRAAQIRGGNRPGGPERMSE